MPFRWSRSPGGGGSIAFGAIECPTLLVHSELDPVPVEWTYALAETIPGADFVLLDGASHFAHIEDSQQLANAVRPWLATHARDPGNPVFGP